MVGWTGPRVTQPASLGNSAQFCVRLPVRYIPRNSGGQIGPAEPIALGGAMFIECPECGRVFDLLDPDDAAEWSTGHDCEAPE